MYSELENFLTPNRSMRVSQLLFGAPNGLKLPVKRYSAPYEAEEGQLGFNILFTHCASLHKEQWEPAIERIFSIQQNKRDERRGPAYVVDAWCLDWPSHGDGAVVNARYMEVTGRPIGINDWALAIAAFVKSSGLTHRNTIAIGHSAGASALVLAIQHFPLDKPPFNKLIFVEPAILAQEVYEEHKAEQDAIANRMRRSILERANSWSNKQEAYDWLRSRHPWKLWDQRNLKLYVDHGLHEAPDGQDGSHSPRVMAKCHKSQEIAANCDYEDQFRAAAFFPFMSRFIPVHLVLGSRTDLVPQYAQDSLCHPARGNIIASLVKVPNAGHQILQEKPDMVGTAIWEIIAKTYINGNSLTFPSKL